MIRIFAVGDIVGRAGRHILSEFLPKIREQYQPDICLLNGENAAGGFGLTEKIYRQFIDDLGIDAITMGNHWHDKKEIFEFRERADRLILPANMSNVKDEGAGLRVLRSHSGTPFAVLNLIGRVFMKEGNRSPFDAASRLLPKIPSDVKVRILDFHGETTSEKQGIAHFLRGRMSLIYGTHSHVPTADERILREGTGYQTDLGATGAYDSIIGMGAEEALKRMLTGQKHRLTPAKDNPWLCGLMADLDDDGKCKKLERIQWRKDEMA